MWYGCRMDYNESTRVYRGGIPPGTHGKVEGGIEQNRNFDLLYFFSERLW